MKWLMLVAFIAFIGAQFSKAEEPAIFLERLSRIYNISMDEIQNCISTSGTQDEDIEYATDYKNKELDRLKKISCLMACIAQKKGVLKDMKIDIPTMIDYFEKYRVFWDPEKLQKFRNSLNACNQEVTEANDACVAFYQLATCVDSKEKKRTNLF